MIVVEGIANTTQKSFNSIILPHPYKLKNHTAHRRVRSNTLAEFEANRANGFRANRVSDRQKDGKTDKDLPNYSMMSLI